MSVIMMDHRSSVMGHRELGLVSLSEIVILASRHSAKSGNSPESETNIEISNLDEKSVEGTWYSSTTLETDSISIMNGIIK